MHYVIRYNSNIQQSKFYCTWYTLVGICYKQPILTSHNHHIKCCSSSLYCTSVIGLDYISYYSILLVYIPIISPCKAIILFTLPVILFMLSNVLTICCSSLSIIILADNIAVLCYNRITTLKITTWPHLYHMTKKNVTIWILEKAIELAMNWIIIDS